MLYFFDKTMVWTQFYHSLPPNQSVAVQWPHHNYITSAWHHHTGDITCTNAAPPLPESSLPHPIGMMVSPGNSIVVTKMPWWTKHQPSWMGLTNSHPTIIDFLPSHFVPEDQWTLLNRIGGKVEGEISRCHHIIFLQLKCLMFSETDGSTWNLLLQKFIYLVIQSLGITGK